MFEQVPDEFWRQADRIPDCWLTELDAIDDWLGGQVGAGAVEVIGHSAGGRPIRAVSYGVPREGRGTTTFSGSLGFRDVRAWLGPDHDQRVYLALGAVHGGEFEGIAGMINLLSVIETGRDLKGQDWPQLAAAAAAVDRLVVVPVVNVDGRARMKGRMYLHRGTDNHIFQGLNTGAWNATENLGWPTCKEFIPLDFSRVMFPGGYPNDAGVNLQHDDFFGRPQPETRLLFDLCARERPDLILNMHTGAPPKNYYQRTHRPFGEPALRDAFDGCYRAIHTALTEAGLQGSSEVELEADPSHCPPGVFNLDTALNLHCGALSVLIEAPCHAFSGHSRSGEEVLQTAEAIVDAQLVCHQAALAWLVESGGRVGWTPPRG